MEGETYLGGGVGGEGVDEEHAGGENRGEGGDAAVAIVAAQAAGASHSVLTDAVGSSCQSAVDAALVGSIPNGATNSVGFAGAGGGRHGLRSWRWGRGAGWRGRSRGRCWGGRWGARGRRRNELLLFFRVRKRSSHFQKYF